MSDTLNINAYSPQSGRFIAEDGTTENLADRLQGISAQLATLGGGGSYDDLSDRPQINSVTLTGNVSSGDLGLMPEQGNTSGGTLNIVRVGNDNKQAAVILDSTNGEAQIVGSEAVNIEGGNVTIGSNAAGETTITGGDVNISPTGNNKGYYKGNTASDELAVKGDILSTVGDTFDHNGLFRGQELNITYGGKYTVAQIVSMVHSGNFNDIYIGDTVTVEITTTLGGTETVELVVAGINSFGGDMAIWDGEDEEYLAEKRNHIALIPKDCFKTTAKMNATNTAAGGYYESEMAGTTLPVYLAALEEIFGADAILAPVNLICSDIDTSSDYYKYYESNYTWYSEDDWEDGDNPKKMQLMTEVEVYGQNILNHSYGGCNTYGLRKQLPIFRLRPDLIQCGRGYNGAQSPRQGWWLQDVANSSNFSDVFEGGRCDYYRASYASGVRPLLYIG